jgi:hypothetical protein
VFLSVSRGEVLRICFFPLDSLGLRLKAKSLSRIILNSYSFPILFPSTIKNEYFIFLNTHQKLILLKQQKDFSKNYENLSNLIEKKLSMI